MLKVITTVLQLIWLFASRWSEIDREKRKRKKELLTEAKEAFNEKDKDLKASRLNAIITKSRQL